MRNHPDKRKALIAILLFIVAAVGVYVGARLLDNENYTETRGTMTEGFGELKTAVYNGETWKEKPAVTTMLVIGVDKADTEEESNVTNYRNGGQADFLMLLAIDHTEKKIHQLQIDRDTMTEISILGVFGNETGSRVLQLCLAHSFGKTPKDNAAYTVKAVQKLLGGLEIDGYYAMNYDAVPVFNDALGGVTVKVPYDMTPVMDGWTEGKEVTLHGDEAELFVRTRKTVGDGSNESRMIRQKEFMGNALATLKARMNKDLSFGENLLDRMIDIGETDFTRIRLVNEVNECYNYEMLPVNYLEGTYTLGKDGFVEFHPEEDAPVRWVLDHLYTKQE